MSATLRTLSDIKTAVRAKLRGKPRVRGSEFLEMFILEKNKSRLEQEKANVGKRSNQIEKDISFLDEELQTLGDALTEGKTDNGNQPKPIKRTPSKPIKVMKVEY